MVKTSDIYPSIRTVEVISTHADRVPPTPAVKEPESYIKWGSDSQFNYDGDFRDEAMGIEDVTDYMPIQGDWYEEGRRYSDFKVTDPEDEEQYVIVQKIEEIAFAGPSRGTHQINQNPSPQLKIAFKNANDSTKYKNSEGKEFEPIVLDPFHTIVDAVWKKGDFALISLVVGPNAAGTFRIKVIDPTDIDLSSDNPIYEGSEELIKNGSGAGMYNPDAPATFTHPEEVTHPDVETNNPVPWRVSPDGMTSWNWTLSELQKSAPNGDHANLQIHWHPGSQNTIFWTSHTSGTGPDYLVNELMMDNFNVPSVGANGNPHGNQQWRLVGAGPGGAGMIYRLWGLSWDEHYDDEPFAYNIAMVKNDKMLKALFTLMQAQQTPSITVSMDLGAYSSFPQPGDKKTYHGPGKMRIMWFRGNKQTLAAADKLLAISFAPGGPGGPIDIDGGGQPQPYLPYPQVWEALRIGQGYIDAAATSVLGGAIVTEAEYTLSSGAAISGAVSSKAKYDLNFQTKTYDKQ